MWFRLPKELHDLHNDYPLAPERLTIQDSWLSQYCLKIKDQFNLRSDTKPKLVNTLNSKSKYVLHAKNLKSISILRVKIGQNI